MTWANKLAFFLIAVIIVFTTMAYGTVHQPVLAAFYLLVALTTVMWAADGWITGAVRFSPEPVQLTLFAAGIYGFLQVIPFGSFADVAGVASIPRTISADPFATQVSAIHFIFSSFESFENPETEWLILKYFHKDKFSGNMKL